MSTASANQATPSNPFLGKTLGDRYNVERLIGRGGMGLVYLARDGDREVVLKMLAPHFSEDADAIARFKREGRRLRQLRHPNIVELYDIGHEVDQSYIVMEFIQGVPLRRYLRHKQKLTLAEFVPLAAQIAAAVGYAHSQFMMLRDIKPSNIMLTTRGGKANFVKMLDFGLAKLVDGDDVEVTKAHVIGTAGYLAPEQIKGEATDVRVDVYALGILFFVMLGGGSPIQGENDGALLYNHVHGTPRRLETVLEPRQKVPQRLVELVHRCMAKDPGERPADGREVAAALFRAVPSSMFELPKINADFQGHVDEYWESRTNDRPRVDEDDEASSSEWTRPRLHQLLAGGHAPNFAGHQPNDPPNDPSADQGAAPPQPNAGVRARTGARSQVHGEGLPKTTYMGFAGPPAQRLPPPVPAQGSATPPPLPATVQRRPRPAKTAASSQMERPGATMMLASLAPDDAPAPAAVAKQVATQPVATQPVATPPVATPPVAPQPVATQPPKGVPPVRARPARRNAEPNRTRAIASVALGANAPTAAAAQPTHSASSATLKGPPSPNVVPADAALVASSSTLPGSFQGLTAAASKPTLPGLHQAAYAESSATVPRASVVPQPSGTTIPAGYESSRATLPGPSEAVADALRVPAPSQVAADAESLRVPAPSQAVMHAAAVAAGVAPAPSIDVSLDSALAGASAGASSALLVGGGSPSGAAEVVVTPALALPAPTSSNKTPIAAAIGAAIAVAIVGGATIAFLYLGPRGDPPPVVEAPVAAAVQPSVELAEQPAAGVDPSAAPKPAVPATSQVQVLGPEGATIFVDGKDSGSLPFDLDIVPGEHTLVVEAAGFERWQLVAELMPGDNETISVVLEEIPTPRGKSKRGRSKGHRGGKSRKPKSAPAATPVAVAPTPVKDPPADKPKPSASDDVFMQGKPKKNSGGVFLPVGKTK